MPIAGDKAGLLSVSSKHNIEFTIGSETGSSRWAKFYLKGLEEWKCAEEFTKRKGEYYTEYRCNEVPEDTVFTVFDQYGDKHGLRTFQFWICAVGGGEPTNGINGTYGSGTVIGNFRLLAHASSTLKASRLMNWWTDKPTHTDLLAYGTKCGIEIHKRGVKECPATLIKPELTSKQMLALDTKIQKLIDSYGLDSLKLSIARAITHH